MIPQYKHAYHQTLVHKIFLARKNGSPERIPFAEALDIIQKIHGFTRGLPQIVYLVGWQFDGHDSKYPSWEEGNIRLKRPEDETAIESLRWLMREARRFNTTVSLHINMDDAYENSPLWEEYVRKDLLIRNADGSLKKAGVWDGEQSYLVCKKREWESGLTRKRIDQLLEMLPIAEAGTVHIDVFAPRENPFHQISLEATADAMKEVLGYWRERGVDVTKEWFHHEFIGLVPMVYHLNMDEASRLKYPPSLICGGGPAWNRRGYRFYEPIEWGATFGAPEAGCLYEEAWGISVDGDIFRTSDLPDFQRDVFLRTVPWLFLNKSRPVRHEQTDGRYSVFFENGIESTIENGIHSLKEGETVFKEGAAYCLPAVWLEDTWVAYDAAGGRRRWRLPENLHRVRMQHGAGKETVEELMGGWLELTANAGEPVWISPC